MIRAKASEKPFQKESVYELEYSNGAIIDNDMIPVSVVMKNGSVTVK